MAGDASRRSEGRKASVRVIFEWPRTELVVNPLGFRYLILFRIAIPPCQLAQRVASKLRCGKRKYHLCKKEKEKKIPRRRLHNLIGLSGSTNWRVFNVLETGAKDTSDSTVKRYEEREREDIKKKKEIKPSLRYVLGPSACLLDRWMHFKCEFPMGKKELISPLNFILIFYSISVYIQFYFYYIQCFVDSKFLIFLKKKKNYAFYVNLEK